MRTTVIVTDPLPGRRHHEPITFDLPGDVTDPLLEGRTEDGTLVVCQRLDRSSDADRSVYAACLDIEGTQRITLLGALDEAPGGIRRLAPVEDDAFVRLDTGRFDLELCQGTARGTGASKWGIRHFRDVTEDVDLLPSGNNAIGGFYGPFFTPENGLINPPEHTTVRIETIEEGPVLHHYRMHGTVPDGLLEELRGKSFAIDWIFTAGTPFFQRRYQVDSFRTVINGRSVTDRITVGDEFEGGPGELVFDRFASHESTRYRAGDPYAQELVAMVRRTLAEVAPEGGSAKFDEFRRHLTQGIASAHWDLYWRMFCTWEKALPPVELTRRLAEIRAESHRRADAPDRPWIIDPEPVDVSSMLDETIFTGAVQKSVEFHSEKGRAMVWWTGLPSGGFQIVQRAQSGWVNWGSNGENECPELPVGVPIKTAYGQFASTWREVADRLETPVLVRVD